MSTIPELEKQILALSPAERETAIKFKIALYPSEEGVAICVPSLPGCWSQGATREEALANISEAIREYLDAEIEPAEGTEVSEIEVAV